MDSICAGYCHCGCGEKTTLARQTDARLGHEKGQSLRYIAGHSWNRMGARPCATANALCEACGSPFHVKPSVLKKGKGKTCSRECYAKVQVEVRGQQHPLWRGGQDKWDKSGSGEWKHCAGCGRRFYAGRKRIRYCSLACHHRTTAKRGATHPLWKGGKKPRNAAESLDWREGVLKRDGYRCQDCGAKSKLHAHHMKPWANFPDLRFDLDNGVTLCRDCHVNRHRKAG